MCVFSFSWGCFVRQVLFQRLWWNLLEFRPAEFAEVRLHTSLRQSSIASRHRGETRELAAWAAGQWSGPGEGKPSGCLTYFISIVTEHLLTYFLNTFSDTSFQTYSLAYLLTWLAAALPQHTWLTTTGKRVERARVRVTRGAYTGLNKWYSWSWCIRRNPEQKILWAVSSTNTSSTVVRSQNVFYSFWFVWRANAHDMS